jgi:hypothetical protein
MRLKLVRPDDLRRDELRRGAAVTLVTLRNETRPAACLMQSDETRSSGSSSDIPLRLEAHAR